MSEIRRGPRFNELSEDTEITDVLFDVDETLVARESRRPPSPAFLQTIRTMGERGVRMTAGLATGRPLPKVEHILTALAEADPEIAGSWSILSNGAQLYSGETGEMVVEHVLSADVARNIARELQSQGIDHWLQDNGVDFTWQGEAVTRGAADLGAYSYPQDPWNAQGAKRKVPVYEPEKPFIFVVPSMTEEQLEHMKNAVADYGRGSAKLMVLGNRRVDGIDTYAAFLLDKRANKKDALEILSEETGTDIAEIAMVGDGLNDLKLIEAAGIGVAMGNGAEEVKRKAHLIAPAMKEDGAAVALRALTHYARK